MVSPTLPFFQSIDIFFNTIVSIHPFIYHIHIFQVEIQMLFFCLIHNPMNLFFFFGYMILTTINEGGKGFGLACQSWIVNPPLHPAQHTHAPPAQLEKSPVLFPGNWAGQINLG
ncbi:hypothetical protein BDC45DRAFT_9006 [Circinella umbellata]|nr:hypothetical protein BDC45DRAFT_9006 [Circinella umbellata]